MRSPSPCGTSPSTRSSCDGTRMQRLESAAPLTGSASACASTASGLRRSLQRRHMQMIALGGVIGAGLFVGSGVVIKSAGPAAVVSCALTGTLVVLVMRMLGEMAAAHPAIGGFYEY